MAASRLPGTTDPIISIVTLCAALVDGPASFEAVFSLNRVSDVQGHGGHICTLLHQQPYSIKRGFNTGKVWDR
jgi:hypothetical protein